MSLIDQINSGPYAADDTPSRVPFFLLGEGAGVVLDRAGSSGSFSFLVADANPVALNPVAAGSTITVSATTGLTVSVLGSPVPNTLSPTAAAINYGFNAATTSGIITITVTSPSGLATSFSQAIERDESTRAPCP